MSDDRHIERGNIKWTSLMLPEHVQMVKKIWEEDEKLEKPVLDAQELEEINFVLHQALYDDLTLHIEYYEDGYMYEVQAKLTYVNVREKKINLIQWKSRDKLSLNFDQIMKASVV